MFIFGLPLVYMHLCIGQYSGLSASGAFWKMMPVASGIGWALVLLALPVSIYYNVIVAWAVYYLWYSIQGIFLPDGLPWSYCQDDWIKNYHCCPLPRVSTSAHNFTQCYSDSQALTAPESFFQ
jgi:solute carrier family 6 amino acid transporter-like protein 5/7/9/14